jgi:hypothetical protein
MPQVKNQSLKGINGGQDSVAAFIKYSDQVTYLQSGFDCEVLVVFRQSTLTTPLGLQKLHSVCWEGEAAREWCIGIWQEPAVVNLRALFGIIV